MGSLILALAAGLDHADCVILSHVMEHVQEVREGTRVGPSGCCGAGGVIYVEVPDATRYARLPDRSVPGLQHRAHAIISVQCSLATSAGCGRSASRSLDRASAKSIEAAAGIPYPAVYAVGRLA